MADVLTMTVLLLESTVRLSVPLVLAALAGLYSERAGVVDVGLEGKMLAGAFAAASVAAITGNPWLGLMAAMLAGLGLALIHGFACVTHHGNQVVSGIALTILVAGLTPTLAIGWFQLGGQTPLLGADSRLPAMILPADARLLAFPLIGPVYQHVLRDMNVMVGLTLVLLLASAWILAKTRFGLRLRAVGANPQAVESAGLSVASLRYRALMIGGVLAGMAGAYLSIAHGAGFVRDMSAGKGYLALAALIFGKWRPMPTLFACLLFAFTDAMQLRLQGVSLPLVGTIPVQFIQMLPYVLTVLLLAGWVGRATPPAALGKPYLRGRQ